jgi:hypothetical protein
VNIARIIAANFARYGKDVGVTSAVLTKSTPGVRTPGAVSGGTNPTTVSYTAQGLVINLTQLRLSGALIAGANAAVLLFGASISGGAVPAPGDRIAIGGGTYTIVGDSGGNQAVTSDPVAATYTCQCRK